MGCNPQSRPLNVWVDTSFTTTHSVHKQPIIQALTHAIALLASDKNLWQDRRITEPGISSPKGRSNLVYTAIRRVGILEGIIR